MRHFGHAKSAKRRQIRGPLARALTVAGVWIAVVLGTAATATTLVVDTTGPNNNLAVFSWYKDRCEQTDIPDAPARAFRDYKGQVHLIATHERNRALVGPDFDHLRHSCTVIYQGAHSDDPSLFDDRQWLTSFTTIDGRNIYAIVHNEYQGNLRRSVCPSGSYSSCWSNSLTFAVSHDGGYSFNEPAQSQKIIATLPYPYQSERGHPVGYFQPTNIVHKHGAYFVMFHAEALGAQRWGECLAKSMEPMDPHLWRAWDGEGFNVEFVDARSVRAAQADEHVCQPVGGGQFYDVGSLSYDPVSDLFILVSFIPKGQGSPKTPPGAYFATSSDLVTWSPSSLIVSAETLDRDAGPTNVKYGFFSMIDESSGSRDFSEITPSPSLFLYYVRFYSDSPPYSRILVKRKLALIRANTSRK